MSNYEIPYLWGSAPKPANDKNNTEQKQKPEFVTCRPPKKETKKELNTSIQICYPQADMSRQKKNEDKNKSRQSSASTPATEKNTPQKNKNEYEFYYSPQLQMKTGAANLYSVYQAIANVLDGAAEKNTSITKSALGRALKTIGVDLPLVSFFEILQHDHSGHGTRAREAGGDIQITNASPFGLLYTGGMNGSFTVTKSIHDNDDYNAPDYMFRYYDKEVKLDTGGFEADKVMADHVLEKMHIEGKASRPQNLAYLASKIDRPLYALFYSKSATSDSFSASLYDPDRYAVDLYFSYFWRYANPFEDEAKPFYYKPVPSFVPSVAKIQENVRAAAAWSLMSPALWRTLGNEWKYISKGQTEFSLPKSFLDTDFNLSPEGPEFYLNCYTHTSGGAPQKAYARHCPIGLKTYGAGVKTFYRDKKGAVRGALGIDAWSQEGGKLGGNIELEYRKQFSRDFFLNLNAGYKTKGYLTGYPEGEGAYFGIGASVRM